MNKHHVNIRFVTNMLIGFAVVLIIVLLPTSTDRTLINGIQTAKSFNFFYGMMGLAGIASLGFLFKNDKPKLNITAIDVLLLAFVVWVTANKYLFQAVHSLSLRYFELLGLMALYIIVRTLKTKHALFLLVAICIGGAVQAVYGNLQLWGHYPSHHGLFKMTGSFFNPGPYAGFLCAVLPVAVGLYWMYESFKLQVTSLTTLRSVDLRFRLAQLGTCNLKPVIIKYVVLITIITILLILPAARSRAAWLGAIAGVAYLAWQKYSVGIRLIAYLKGRTKSPFEAKRSPENREGKQRSVLANLGVVLIPLLFILVASISLYHYKKDSADGRLLIWTITANIIKDNPLLGVGHDRFKAHYMDHQADYFRNNPGSKYEQVADDNQYAFNEPLNIWAENGLIGLILAGGIVFAVFNFRFQISSSEKDDSKFQVPSFITQPGTWNLKLETERSVVKPETILKASLLSILVFGLFAYSSEILPIKIVAITCLGLLANYFESNTSNTQRSAASNDEAIKREASNTSAASIERERSELQTAKRSAASNGEAQPETCNLNRNEVETKHREVPRSGIGVAKLVIIAAILLITIVTYPKIRELHGVNVTWKNAMDLYTYGLYEQCLSEYEKAYPKLKNNGEFLINYGKALSIAEKHSEAIEVLARAKTFQTNSVLYNALGDSHKALEEYQSAEQNYLQAANMAPGKFYPLYLLAKMYDTSGQQQKAIAMANTILNKEVKVHSTAIDEIKAEMKTIIAK